MFPARRRGFTLIEILMVISIIAVLSSIILFSISDARAGARDKQRLVDLKQLELALELYYEINGEYPPQGCGQDSTYWVTAGPGVGSYRGCDEYIENLAPTYIPQLPLDPRSEDENNMGFAYRTAFNNSEYKIINNSVEKNLIDGIDHEFSRCDSSCTSASWGDRCTNDAFFSTYAVYRDSSPGNNGGAECF